MKTFINIFLGCIAATIVVLVGACWLRERAAYQNTIYSARYTKEAFARIKIGTPRAAVIEALGPPLHTSTRENYPVWAIPDAAARARYRGSDNISVEGLMFSGRKNPSADFNAIYIKFGPEDTAILIRNYVTD